MEQDIQITDIEAQLTRLWEEHKTQNRIRAGLFTLILYTQEKRRAEHFRKLVRAIIEKFPCRIICIQVDPLSKQDHLRVDVSNEIVEKNGGGVACDLILIDVSLNQLKRVPFIILPHLVPDLPIYCLWGANPIEDNVILPECQRFADRLIFDADCTDSLSHFAEKILADMKQHPHHQYIDMKWAFMACWRNVLNQAFDTQASLTWLKNAHTLNIRFNSHCTEQVQHSETQAIYLSCWLAGQLGWTFNSQKRENSSRKLIFKKEKDNCVINLYGEPHTDLFPGAIVDFEMTAEDEHQLNISFQQDLSKVVVHISSLETCELPFILSIPSLRRSYPDIKELLFAPMSPHYANMLIILKTLK